MSGFVVSHGSVTDEKALEAAANVEQHLGRLLNGDKNVFKTINVEDLVVLIQFARDKASDPNHLKCEHGVIDGDFCLPCNCEYKLAAIENESAAATTERKGEQ